jgi:DNA polymerase-3 subunit delta'
MTALHPVVGHEATRAALARAHAAGGLPAALLVHGLRGVGKQRLAHWIAQLRVCESPGPDGPCGTCRPCRLALAIEHPDIHWYFPLPRPKGVSGDRLAEALESARADALVEMREQPLRPSQADELRGIYLGLVQGLRRRAHVTPTMARVQVFIIADAEYLVPQEASPEAANALLKLLEEPPGGSRFVLTSGEPGRLLPTIRSRSVPLHLAPLPLETVATFLQERRGVDADTARWAAGLGQGSIGRALGFLPDGEDPGPQEVLRREALTIVEAALADTRSAGWSAALGYSTAGARTLVELFAFVEEWLRDVAAVAAGSEERVRSQDILPHLRKLVRGAGVEAADAAAALPAVEEARELARGNVNPQLIVSGLVRRLRRSLRREAAEAVPGGAR